MRIIAIALLLFISKSSFSQRVLIEDEKLKYTNNPSLLKLIIVAETDETFDLVYKPRQVTCYIGDDSYIVPGLNWTDTMEPLKNQIYSGVYIKINNQKKIFASMATIRDTVKVSIIKKELGIISDLIHFQKHVKDLEVVTPPGTNKIQEVMRSNDNKYAIVIEGTNKIIALSLEKKTYIFVDSPIIIYDHK